jgi:diacylglycerol kinase (ATP)
MPAARFIILNPQAGQQDLARLRRRIGGAFAERNAPFDLVTTEYAGHASVLAREAAALGYRAVAVCGGDGTLAEAATGLAGSAVPLAIIPRGTGNQVAQNLGIPLALRKAIDVAVHGRRSASTWATPASARSCWWPARASTQTSCAAPRAR